MVFTNALLWVLQGKENVVNPPAFVPLQFHKASIFLNTMMLHLASQQKYEKVGLGACQ